MIRARLSLIFLAIPAMGIAQESVLQDYLKVRRQHSISQAASVAALETLVGSRIVEIKCKVRGSIRGADSGVVMVETEGGKPLSIEAAPVPDWLGIGVVNARLLIKASRNGEMGPLKATLIGAIPEDVMGEWERKNPPKAAPRPTAKTPIKQPVRKPVQTSSRSGGATRAPKEIEDWNLPASDALPYYIEFVRKENPKLSAKEAERIARGIIGFSIKYGVDARLVCAMIIAESNFRPNLTSHAGAMGLGQLMPGTAKSLGVTNAYDSVDNLSGMVKLIRQHMDKYSDKTGGDEYDTLVLMLAAYNAGPGAVKRHGGVPPFRETQNYVKKVIAIYRRLCGE